LGDVSTFDKAIRKDGDLLSVPVERKTLSEEEVVLPTSLRPRSE
jgi:hypothetical protein